MFNNKIGVFVPDKNSNFFYQLTPTFFYVKKTEAAILQQIILWK